MKKSVIAMIALSGMFLSGGNLCAKNISPKFVEDGKYIEMIASSTRCGGVTFEIPKWVKEVKLKAELKGARRRGRDDLGGSVTLKGGQKHREKYGNLTGRFGGGYYRITCTTPESGKSACSTLVKLKNIRHNKSCATTLLRHLETQAEYKGLSMKSAAAY